MIDLTDGPIDIRAVEAAVAWPGAGAVLTFAGVARNESEGRPVCALEYEAYRQMAVPVMEAIRDEIHRKWPGVRAAMVHRTGRLEIGEPSVVIAVAAAHRAEAYEASRYAIEQLKARVPIWKKEVFEDGAAWKANV